MIPRTIAARGGGGQVIDSLSIFPAGFHGHATVGPHGVIVALVAIALTIGIPAVATLRRERK